MAINWQMGIAPDIIGNALNAFEEGRKLRRENDARNALGTIVQNPNDQAAWGTLLKADPATGLQAKKYFAEEQRKAQMAALLPKAAAGDPTALQQVMGIDFDTWKSLDANKRQQIKLQNDYIGQSALRISQLPPEQQPQAWDQAIAQGVQQGYTDLAQYQGKYSEQALRGAIDNAGLVDKFISLAEPKYMPIPAGGTLVNTRDPKAVATLQGGTQSGPAPGSVVGGYRFKGGNPNDRNSWEPAGGPTQPASGGFHP